jgi:hypothetical protein
MKWCNFYNVWCDEVEDILELPRDFLECDGCKGDGCEHAQEIGRNVK